MGRGKIRPWTYSIIANLIDVSQGKKMLIYTLQEEK